MKKNPGKVKTVMHEFKAGKLHSGKSGKIVKNPKKQTKKLIELEIVEEPEEIIEIVPKKRIELEFPQKKKVIKKTFKDTY